MTPLAHTTFRVAESNDIAVRSAATAVRSGVKTQIDLNTPLGMPKDDDVNYRPHGMEICPPRECLWVREANRQG